MIGNILALLNQNLFGVADEIDIAKGKYSIPTNLREMINIIKIWLLRER